MDVVFSSHDIGYPLEGFLLPPRLAKSVGSIVKDGREQVVVRDLKFPQQEGRLAEVMPPVVERVQAFLEGSPGPISLDPEVAIKCLFPGAVAPVRFWSPPSLGKEGGVGTRRYIPSKCPFLTACWCSIAALGIDQHRVSTIPAGLPAPGRNGHSRGRE